ncbi:MAG: molybdenum cofactor guanylyltransferase MobA [Pseudomonadota bacterium]
MKKHYVSGLILSGGRSSRMGNHDKGLVLLNGKAMIEHVNDILISQVDDVIISANQNIESYQYLNHQILSDEYDDFRGPLAGIYEGLKAIDKDSFLMVVPCDGPLFPADLCKRMLAHITETDSKLATVFDGKYRQPTYSLIHQSLKNNLQQFLATGERKLGQWLSENQTQLVDFSDQPEAFININSEADLMDLQQK